MDGKLARETERTRPDAFRLQAGGVGKIDVRLVERQDARRRAGMHHSRARPKQRLPGRLTPGLRREILGQKIAEVEPRVMFRGQPLTSL